MRTFSLRKETLVAIAIAGAVVAGAAPALRRPGETLGTQSVSSRLQRAVDPGPVDIGFAQHMALHHDQAVVMAKIVQGRATGRINLLAESITTDQLMEIGELKGWLKLWGAPLLPTDSSMNWMFRNPNATWSFSPAYLDLCRSSPAGMPGIASFDELNTLRSASGKELEILFLQLMLRHHQGAIPMSKYAANNAETAVVRASASRMAYEQRREVKAMRILLKDHGAEPLPFIDEEEM